MSLVSKACTQVSSKGFVWMHKGCQWAINVHFSFKGNYNGSLLFRVSVYKATQIQTVCHNLVGSGSLRYTNTYLFCLST